MTGEKKKEKPASGIRCRTYPKAMALVLCYYAVFTPLSTLLGNWLVESCGWNEYLVTVMNMLLNFVTEYLFDTFVVFRGSMDTNDLAKKEEQK